MAAVTTYSGYSYSFNDCRTLRKELYTLELYVCFTTNWYVWIIEVLMAITAVLFFFMMWTTCFAIKEIDDAKNQTQVMKPPMGQTYPQDAVPSNF